MSEWKPIESAPKDGSQVIVRFVTDGGDIEVKNAWFGDGWRRVCHWLNHYEYFGNGKVTHWMPLPEPPDRSSAGPS